VANVLFGSHTPFFVTRAASMKVAWCELSGKEREQIASGNARKLFRLPNVGEGGAS
jgi:predicted TIM-barrel fold metal-dependent hydrolase